MPEPGSQIIEYHQASKHHFRKYARGPGYLDWRTQPDPFRRYHGSTLVRLERIPPSDEPLYDAAYTFGRIPASPISFHTISRLFFDSLALSAWKRAGADTWPLRVNPSSGNLHPTEGYLICGPVEGLAETPGIFHYAPKEHALELRAKMPEPLWGELTEGLPDDCILVGLTSIHWREAWKYGERAYRYCQHDVGHALGAISLSASALGLQATLLDQLSTEHLALLLGVSGSQDAEPEHPDCILAIHPYQERTIAVDTPAQSMLEALSSLSWQGEPNSLSRSHVDWPAIDTATMAAFKPAGSEHFDDRLPVLTEQESDRSISFRRIIHQRRSAVAMDGHTSMPVSSFYRALQKTMPKVGSAPLSTLPWTPRVHLALFVHRVDGISPGLYFLIRDERERSSLQAAMHEKFLWEKPDDCPENLGLYLLAVADAREASMKISCFQDIAGDGCFSVAMIVDFEGPVRQYGPWFYPRLFWECGMIGQILYLEAEAAGLRGTGIGCFFDDPTHELLGLHGLRYQDLYHFTMGGPIEDTRLSTLPPYPA
jgi:SagB-type dehydrogenase family enzyme